MTTDAPPDLETLRVLLWWQWVLVASGLANPEDIELLLREKGGLEYQTSGNLAKFAKGMPPYRRSKGPKLVRAIWPERVQAAWPAHGTLAWLSTPFWFLISREPNSSVLLECIGLLPENLRELLLEDEERDGHHQFERGERPSPGRLTYLIREVVYELALNVSAMRLGALACAMHRARLAGQADLERLAMVACAWMLMEMVARVRPQQRRLVEHLLDYFLLYAADYVFCTGVSMSLLASEIDAFVVARQKHAEWSVEEELALIRA